MKKNLLRTLLCCLVAVTASLGGRSASAGSQEIDYIEFARGTKDVVIGGLTVNYADRPAPMNPYEIKALFADVIENEIIKKLGMNVIPSDMYWGIVIKKKADSKKISNVLSVTGVLSFYSKEHISESQQKDIAILSLYSSKAQPNQDEDRFTARFDVDPRSLKYNKPLLFVVEPDKELFEKQLRDALLTKLRGEIVPILCFDTPRPAGCEEIALPPPTKKDGVSPPQ